MLRRTERSVFCYDLVVGARATHATPPPFLEIAVALKDMYDADTCSHEREKGTVIYRIGDIDIDQNKNILKILMRRCDTNAANAVYSHKKTGIPRIALKQIDEGGDKAAHLIISLTEEAGKPHTYLCHLEGVPGLSHRLIQATINSIIKTAARNDKSVFQFPDPAGAKVKGGGIKYHSFMPSIEMIGHPSDLLVNDLENGRISNIEMIDNRPRNSLGGNKYLSESSQTIRVKVDQKLPSKNRLSSIIAALQTRKADYQTAKIRFTDPTGQHKSIDYDIASGTPEQQTYVQSYVVEKINPPMDESSVKLVPFLSEKMEDRLIADRT